MLILSVYNFRINNPLVTRQATCIGNRFVHLALNSHDQPHTLKKKMRIDEIKPTNKRWLSLDRGELTEDEPVGPKLLTLPIQETESLIS